MSPDPRVVTHLLSGAAHALVSGELEWVVRQGGTRESRLTVYADGFAPDAVELIVRAATTAPESLVCVVNLEECCVLRGCWNSPHRDGGHLYDLPTHGHTYNSGRREVFVPDAPLAPVEPSETARTWARREALYSFSDWARIDRQALVWTEPDPEGGW